MPDSVLDIRGLVLMRPGAGASRYAFVVPALSLRRGARYSLFGPSGSGKSTALDLMSMILKPNRADLFVLHTGSGAIDAAAAWRTGSIDALARARSESLGYVLQTGGLMPFLSVRDNILLPRAIKGLPGDGPLEELSEHLGIAHLLKKPAGSVSVGERQRTGIARALIHEPELVLADEPTAALDPYTADDVMRLLVALSEARGVTLLVASHDWDRMRAWKFTELRIDVQRRENATVAELVAPAS